MRLAVALLVALICLTVAPAQAPPKLDPRYDLDYDSFNYPQGTPEKAMASVVKAIQDKRVNYLLAHLTDPAFVDQRVQDVHRGKFAELVKEVSHKLVNDPDSIKLLERFAKEGQFETGDTTASARLKDTNDKVFFRRIELRWFFQNQKKEEKAAEKPAEKPAEKQDK
jgi:hypothetical protein